MSLKSDVKRDDAHWLVMPEQVESQLQQWVTRFPEHCRLTHEESPSGHRVYLAEVGQPADGALDILIVQPHGHEPAATAAIMELLSELIAGRRLDGRPTDLPCQALLERCRLAINPLGNPDGRGRMPTLCWTNEFSLEEVYFYFNGKERGGTYLLGDRKRVMRVGEVDLDPNYPPACRWENCGGGLSVDPWGWTGSFQTNPTTLARLVRPVAAVRPLALILDMHQVPIGDGPAIWMPELDDPDTHRKAAALATEVETAWRRAGYGVCERHPYQATPGFVRGLHAGGAGRPVVLTVEIGMGIDQASPWMTPDRQKEAGLVAMHAALKYVLEEGLTDVMD